MHFRYLCSTHTSVMKFLSLKKIPLIQVAACICLSACSGRVTIKNPLDIKMGKSTLTL